MAAAAKHSQGDPVALVRRLFEQSTPVTELSAWNIRLGVSQTVTEVWICVSVVVCCVRACVRVRVCQTVTEVWMCARVYRDRAELVKNTA